MMQIEQKTLTPRVEFASIIAKPFIRIYTMKAITLILAAATALSFSACCCQSQPAPKLHPMPKDLDNDVDNNIPGNVPDQPIKVYQDKKGK